MRQLSLHRLILLCLLVPALFSSCGYGIVGKKTTAEVDKLDRDLTGALSKLQDTAFPFLNHTRDGIYDFLKNQSEEEAHALSVGILKGTIGYLDADSNREALSKLLESIITHAGGAARAQLITFKDQLLDPTFIRQSQELLRGVMQELILHPADNLFNIVLGKRTRDDLEKLLKMVIPAAINDSAITQIAKLREALLGGSLKRDVAGIVDTAIITLDSQLNRNLKPSIQELIDHNTSTVKKNAWGFLIGLAVAAIIIIWVVYYVQHRKAVLNREMLRQVTQEIEKAKKADPASYDYLTGKIEDAMKTRGLEGELNQFLKKENIS